MPDSPSLMTPKPVFISYSRANADFARQLYEQLRVEGFRLWRDRSEMEAGKDWWQQIQQAIRESDTMLLVLSPKALESPVVTDEWRYARQVGTRVIPVIAEAVDFSGVPGWMKRVDWADLRPDAPERDLTWTRVLNQLRTPYEPRRVPFMVDALPKDFVPRPHEYTALLGHLTGAAGGEPVAITAALRGAGGYGKTTLARALCYDERVQARYDDGILWVELGEKADNLLGKVLDLITVLTGERPDFTGLEAARTRLAEAIGDRAILLVIDDVWDAAHLRPFLSGGGRCARLITTRNKDTLPREALRTDLDAMRPDEAAALLAAGLDAAGQETALRAMAARLGEWPLLLKLVNGVLRDRTERGEALPAALEHARRVLDKRGLTGFDQRSEADRHRAVTDTVSISLAQLDAAQRAAYEKLAVFPEDADVPLAALERLWGLDDLDTEDLCGRLESLSLALRFDLTRRTLRLHDVLRAYLIRQAGPELLRKMQTAFLDSYGLTRWADLPADEAYLWDGLAYHLIEAGQAARLRETLLDLRWLGRKAFLRNAQAAEADLTALLRVDASEPIPLLVRNFANLGHLLNAAETEAEALATLHSRLTHLEALAAPCATLEAELPGPSITAWHSLPDLPHPNLIRTLAGHTRNVTACAISPDRCWIVSASSDQTLRVWDAKTGVERRTLAGHEYTVNGCAISPDGRWIVSASYDDTLKIWDAETGVERRTLVGHMAPVSACAVSPDGQRIVSASSDKTLKVWDLETGAERRTLAGHTRAVNACAISPDGRWIVSASEDRTLKIWDAETGVERRTLAGHTDVVTACAVSPDGRWLVSASWDNTLRVWDSETGAERRTLAGHEHAVNGCAVSPNGRWLVSASQDGTLKVWDAEMGVEQRTLKGHIGKLTACAISPDGRWIVSASYDDTLKIWDAETGVERRTQAGHEYTVNACAISPDGRWIVSASEDRTLKIWDAETGVERRTLAGHELTVNGCAISPDGHWIFSASGDGTLKVWDSETGAERQTLAGHTRAVNACAISPDARWIVSASGDQTLTVWHAKTRVEPRTLAGHTGAVTACAISPDGHWIVSASSDNTLKVWDAKTGVERRTLAGHLNEVRACVISPDGRWIVSASYDQTLKVWDAAAETGVERLTLTGHTSAVTACAISPDGSWIVSASWDYTLRLWALETGACRAVLRVDGGLLCVAFHPDGRHLVVGGVRGLYWLRLVGSGGDGGSNLRQGRKIRSSGLGKVRAFLATAIRRLTRP